MCIVTMAAVNLKVGEQTCCCVLEPESSRTVLLILSLSVFGVEFQGRVIHCFQVVSALHVEGSKEEQ